MSCSALCDADANMTPENLMLHSFMWTFTRIPTKKKKKPPKNSAVPLPKHCSRAGHPQTSFIPPAANTMLKSDDK